MNIENLVAKLKTLPDCVVHPPSGVPNIEEGLVLPYDVINFYLLCGGVHLFTKSDYSISIVSPKGFEIANPVIVGERCEEDISSNWYIVADDGNGDYLTIDLAKERLGKCYDSFWDKHGVAGDCSIIAISFTDLLLSLIENKGNRWYWLQDDFESLGDAYKLLNSVVARRFNAWIRVVIFIMSAAFLGWMYGFSRDIVKAIVWVLKILSVFSK